VITGDKVKILMKIFLDLSISKVSKVQLCEGERVVDELTGDSPLPLINDLLKKHNLKLEDLEEVGSYPGPGSFTGLKVGAAIANVLNWQLGKEKIVKPVYEPTRLHNDSLEKK